MPSLCNYKMCHNLASSSYQGYCNEVHYKRALILDLKEQMSTLTASLTQQVDLPLQTLPSKESVSVPHNTPNGTPPASNSPSSLDPTGPSDTAK